MKKQKQINIKYSDQHLAKTLYQKSLLFILILITAAFIPWYIAIITHGITESFTVSDILPVALSLFAIGFFAWFIQWLYKDYTIDHDNFVTRYMRVIELRQIISTLLVSNNYYQTKSDDKGEYISYFPKVRIKVLFKTGQVVIEEPIDGHSVMTRFSKGEFDTLVETVLLADKQTTEFEKDKMISTFAFEPIKFRHHLLDLQPTKGNLEIAIGIDWLYDKFYNALITGNVGTGKSYMMFSIIGQLLAITKQIDIIDPKRSDLASLKYVDELKGRVHSTQSEINQAVIEYYEKMMARAEKLETIKASGKIGSYFDFGFKPCFLVFDEFGAYREMNERLSYSDPKKEKFDTAMSNLNEIAMLGRELGFYIIIGMQRPDSGTLPMSIRGQLNFRINMGVPTPEVEKMVFPDTDKQLRPLSSRLKGWGFLKMGDGQVRSFFAPEIPRDFNLHEYMRSQIAKQERTS